MVDELDRLAIQDLVTGRVRVNFGALVSWLLRESLSGELHRLAFPVVSGCGKRMLAEPSGNMSLKLAVAAAFETGVLNLTCAGA